MTEITRGHVPTIGVTERLTIIITKEQAAKILDCLIAGGGDESVTFLKKAILEKWPDLKK